MTRLGAGMLFCGIASFVLPMVGMQYDFLDGLEPQSLLMTQVGLIVGGLVVAGLGNSVEGNA